MTVDEIFAELKKHALEGMVFHDMMARYYDFLGLRHEKDRHERQYYGETEGYRDLCSYYMGHYNRFIPETKMDQPVVIPETWYRYKRQEVDVGTKTSAVKAGVRKWVEWEQATKQLYEDMTKELIDIGETAAARFLSSYVKAVDDELCEAERKQINLEAINYDLAVIILGV